MKKFLFFVVAAATALVACNPVNEESTPSVSFEMPFPDMAGDVGTFRLLVSDYSGTEPVTIPVAFGGTAEKGVDYEVSAEEFVYGGQNPITSISITQLTFNENKEITLTLGVPAGFKGGKYTVSAFSIVGKIGYASFSLSEDKLVGSGSIEVVTLDDNGQKLNLDVQTEIAVSVDTKLSTAVEGVHFQFVDDVKAAVVEQGENKGYVKIELIGDLDPSKNKIVLDISDRRFKIGQTKSVEITMDSYWAKMNGTWQMTELITDKAFFIDAWMADNSQLDGFPEFNEADKFTIDVANNKFIPSFSSTFKNYFIGESNISNKGGIDIMAGMGDKRKLQLLLLDNTNRDFSSTSTSADKESYIGALVYIDETTQDEILDLYVIDYKPTSFFPHYDDYDMWGDNKPVATVTYAYLNATFKKVTE